MFRFVIQERGFQEVTFLLYLIVFIGSIKQVVPKAVLEDLVYPSKKIIDLHGYKITVQSEMGKGTCLTVTILL